MIKSFVLILYIAVSPTQTQVLKLPGFSTYSNCYSEGIAKKHDKKQKVVHFSCTPIK